MAVASNDIVAAKHWSNVSTAAKLAIGNPLIDELPPGVQGGAEDSKLGDRGIGHDRRSRAYP